MRFLNPCLPELEDPYLHLYPESPGIEEPRKIHLKAPTVTLVPALTLTLGMHRPLLIPNPQPPNPGHFTAFWEGWSRLRRTSLEELEKGQGLSLGQN